MELGDHGLEHQAHARPASSLRDKVRLDHPKTESLGGSMRPHGGSPSIESTQSAQCRPKKRIAPIIRIRLDSSTTDS
jgi:hypothetical protein